MDELNVLFRRFLTAAGLGVLGLVATPVGILLAGSVLFFLASFPGPRTGLLFNAHNLWNAGRTPGGDLLVRRRCVARWASRSSS